MQGQELWIDLRDIELSDLEVLTQEGARGIPEFAASTSCGSSTNCGCCCCGMEEPVEAE